MKHKYQLPALTRNERRFMYYMLHGVIDRQRWYGVVRLRLWKSEGIVCIQ